jgi:hypothetical protein
MSRAASREELLHGVDEFVGELVMLLGSSATARNRMTNNSGSIVDDDMR